MPDDPPDLPPGFLLEPVPNAEAIAFLKDKPAVAGSVFRKMLPEVKARAFGISGIESATVARDIREAIAAVPAGADWDKQKRLIADTLHPYLGDPEDPANKKAVNARAELLLRTHGFQAYAVAQHETMRAQQDIFPWWQYLTMGDEKVRPAHKALDKLIFPAASPFWTHHSPPWAWGCRCRKAPLLDVEVEEIRAAEMDKAPEAKTVIEGPALKLVEEQNRLDRGPSQSFDIATGADKGQPGAYVFEPDSLKLSPAQLKPRYDAETWAEFETWSKKTEIPDQDRSVWDWLGETGDAAPVPTPTPQPVPVPAPAPAPSAPRSLADVGNALAPLATQMATRQAAKAAAAARFAALPATPASLAEAQRLAQEMADLQAEMEQLREQAREAVAIPAADRGKVNMGKVPKSCQQVAAAGADLTERYTHKDLCPKVEVKLSRSARAFHRGGEIHINGQTKPSTVLHEITHATEQQDAATLQAAQDFLQKRAGTEPLQTLRKLTGIRAYRADEYAWEDEFAKRGGNHYMGKSYGPRATELLTMGIERLHRDPLEFLANDREYFDFLVGTLQKL